MNGPADGVKPAVARRVDVPWLVGAVVVALLSGLVGLGLWAFGLQGEIDDEQDVSSALRADVAQQEATNAGLEDRLTAVEEVFPLTTETMASADLTGRYSFVFAPAGGVCTYSDCADIGTPRYVLHIGGEADAYDLSIEGVGGSAPLRREGGTYRAAGLLPESMWGVCDGQPSETTFEFVLLVGGVELVDDELRALEVFGSYLQYDSSGVCDGQSELAFYGRRSD